MPSELLRNDATGEFGRLHMIRGKQRFIANDPQADPAADIGPLGAALIGFGETLSNTALRAQAAADTLTGKTGTVAQTEFADVKALLAPLEEDHGFAIALGQSAPGFLLPASKVVQTVGGVAEGLLADPENPILGGILGGVGGFVGGVLGEKIGAAVTARLGGAVGRLASRNIPTTLAQRTGRPAEQGIEAGLQAVPIISSWAARPARAQQRALNSGASSVFGYEGKLTTKGLGDIKFGMQKSFREVEVGIPDQVLEPKLLARIDDAGALDQATKELMDETAGILDGEALMAIRSSLNNDMADAFINANRKEGRKLRGILNEVDALIESGLGPRLTEQWSTVRKQWQFFTAITKGKAINRAGDVNLATMNNALDKVYPNFRFGRELPATAKGFGELVQALDELPKALQSSGTAERVAAAAAITNPLKSALAIPTAILPAGRAVGQRGVDVGATFGIATAQPATQLLEDTPIGEALRDILRERELIEPVAP